MNVKPKYIPYNIRRMCKVSLIEYVHENDVETMYLEVNLTDDGEPIELLGSYNYSASMINKATKALIKDDVPCSLNESGNVVIKIDDFHTLGAQDILIELTVSNQNRSKVLVPPFPLWIHVNESILDDAQITPESEGTIPDLLKNAKEALENALDYEKLENKPKINGHELVGDLSTEDLEIESGSSISSVKIKDNGSIEIENSDGTTFSSSGRKIVNSALQVSLELDENGKLYFLFKDEDGE